MNCGFSVTINQCSLLYFATDNKVNTFFCPGCEAMSSIVASPSCTAYHWGTLIALYRAVHQEQLINWQKASPFEQYHLFKGFFVTNNVTPPQRIWICIS